MLYARLRLVLSIGIVSGITFIGSCSKGSSGPSSAEGQWAYTTPDNKIKVTFELVKTSSGSYDIQNQTMSISGISYNSEKIVTGVALPAIASIRINANDAKIVYPYYILFSNGKVSGDFRKIDVPDAEYTFPWGTVNTLKAISIIRP